MTTYNVRERDPYRVRETHLPVHNERQPDRSFGRQGGGLPQQAQQAVQGMQQGLQGMGDNLNQAVGQVDGRQLAQALGWFSIGLGVAQVAAPQMVAEFIGIGDSPDTRLTMSAFGLREIANGLAILAQPDNPVWVQTRVAGDVMDLAALSMASSQPDNDQGRLKMALGAVAGITALDALCSWLLMSGGSSQDKR